MIACRSFSRVDRIWKVASVANVLPNSVHYFQGCFRDHHLSCVWKMDGARDESNVIDRKMKRKAVIPIWRQVSTQSASNGEATPSLVNLLESGDSESVDNTLSQEKVIAETANDLIPGKVVELVDGNESHSVSIEVDASLIRFVKGKWGSTQRQIEGEIGVKIIFPLSKEETTLVIKGSSNESVTKASQKIASILEAAVKSPNLDYSHFVSLPLAIHPELVEKLHNFQNDILGDANSSQEGNLDSDSNEDTSNDGDDQHKNLISSNVAVILEVQDDKEHVRVEMDASTANNNASKPLRSSALSDMGIDRSIFIKPKTFHLTVLMLKLWNKERIAAATEVMQRISSKVKDALDNRPVFIKLKGLPISGPFMDAGLFVLLKFIETWEHDGECMKGSLAKARVIYAPVEEIGGEGRLLRACQVIREAYVEAGLVLEKDAQQKLKLHATLMNARHRKSKNRTARRDSDSFDARSIYRRYGSEEWGEYLIREVHLSQRFAFDQSGYYNCCASIPFPENMQVE